MSKADFKGISSFGDFFDLFRTLDQDRDGSISVEESKADVDAYDLDRNASVEVWEMAKAVQKSQPSFSSLSLFDGKKIERLKTAQRWVQNKEGEIDNELPAIEAQFFIEETEFTKEQKEFLVKTVAEHIPDRTDPKNSSHIFFLEGIPGAVQHLKDAGYTDEQSFAFLEKFCRNIGTSSPLGFFLKWRFADFFDALQEQGIGKAEMTELLPRLAGIIDGDEDAENAPKVVAVLRKEGYTTAETTKLLNSISYQYSHIFKHLLPIFEAMKKAGIGNLKRDEILVAIARKARWHTDLVYPHLPGLIDTLRAMKFPQAEVEKLLIGTLSILYEEGKEIGEACRVLVPTVEALFLSGFKPEEMIRMVQKIFRLKGESLTEEFFPQIFEILSALQETGFEKMEIEAFFEQFHRFSDSDLYWRERWEKLDVLPSALRTLQGAGLSKETIPSFILELETILAGVHLATALKQIPWAAKMLMDSSFDSDQTAATLLGITYDWKRSQAYSLFEPLEKAGCNAGEIIFLLKELKAKGADEYRTYEENLILKSIPSAALALTNQELDGEEIISLLLSVYDILGENTHLGYLCFASLIRSGISARDIPFLLSEIKTKIGGGRYEAGEALRNIQQAVENLSKWGYDGAQIREALTGLASDAGFNTHFAYRLLAACERAVPPEEFLRFRENIGYFMKWVKGSIYRIVDLLESSRLKLDLLLMGSDRLSLSQEIATAINNFYRKNPGFEILKNVSQQIAVLLNTLHDGDQPDDLVRKTIVQNLSNRAVYFISALGGSDLYTSTFVDRLFALRIQNNPAFLKEVKEKIDPTGRHLTEFILTLAGFHRFWPVFQADPDYFTQKLALLVQVEDKEVLMKNVALLTSMIGELLGDSKLTRLKNYFEKLFLDEYSKAKKKGDKTRQAVFGYIIKHEVYGALFTDRGMVHAIAKELPPILMPQVPDSWLKDKTIRAKLYFYPDEKDHFRLIQRMYREKGFTIEEKNRGETVVMRKKINGNFLEVIVTLDNEDVKRALADPAIDIIGHRGHSFHLDETFSYCHDCKDRKKLLYLGSCGSFRSIPKLMENYVGNYFISDEDAGRGADNNETLYYMMEAIALGEKDWDKIKNYVFARHDLGSRGLLFPTDRGMLLFDYVQRVKNGS